MAIDAKVTKAIDDGEIEIEIAPNVRVRQSRAAISEVRAKGEPVKNQDLWQRLHEANSRHKVHWHWVKGHAGHAENERVDGLARLAAESFK